MIGTADWRGRKVNVCRLLMHVRSMEFMHGNLFVYGFLHSCINFVISLLVL